MGFFVEVEQGVKLYVEDIHPSGTHTIVFLHGWPLSGKQFEYQLDALPRYNVRCICIDWRGFGKSDKPSAGYELDRLADDIAVVLKTLGVTHFILLGHSTGGAIAVRMLTRHPALSQETRGLVLLSAAVPTGIAKDVAQEYINMTLHDRPHMIEFLTDQFFFQYATEALKRWFFTICLEAAGWSTAAVMNMLSELDLNADLAKLTMPILILHGVHDGVVPFSQAEQLHKQLPSSQLIPLANSGHGAFWEEHEEMNDILLKWIGANSGQD